MSGMASQRTGWHMHGSSLEVLEDDYCRCGDTVDRRPVILLDPAGLAARDARVRAEALAPERRYHEVVEAWLWRWQCPPEALADLRAALASEPTP